MEHLTELDCAYAAGIVDGEGCILLCEHKRLGNRCRTPVIIPTISVIMQDKEAIEFLGKHFRGRTKMYRRVGKKDYYRFDVSARNEVAEFLGHISPYLKVKERQASIMWEFLALPKFYGGRNCEVPPEQLLARRLLVKSMHALNQREV